MKLIDTAFQLFIQNGIRAVSMNDIERASGAKSGAKMNKTLVVNRCARKMENDIFDLLSVPKTGNENPTHQILEIYKGLVDYLLNVNLAFFNDLKKHHRENYDHMTQFMDIMVFHEVKNILQKGQIAGTISKDIDTELECIIHKMMLERMVSEFRFQMHHFDVDQVFEQLFKSRFEGISIAKQ